LVPYGLVEGISTGAGSGCGRVVNGEALLRDGVLEIDRGTCEVRDAHLVNDDLDAIELADCITFEHALIEVKLVNQARAAAWLYGNAQTKIIAAFLFQK